jgi:hypothetical protein
MVTFALTTVPIGSCSRDPVGYWDGANLFQLYVGLSKTDSSGTSIVIGPPPPPSNNFFDPILHPIGSPPPGCIDTPVMSNLAADCVVPSVRPGVLRTVRATECFFGEGPVDCCSRHFGDGVQSATLFRITKYTRKCVKPCGISCGLAPTPVTCPKVTTHPIGAVLLIVGLVISLENDTETEPLEEEVELCNCCDVEMEPGGQFTIWTNCRQIPKDECLKADTGTLGTHCVPSNVKDGQRVGILPGAVH